MNVSRPSDVTLKMVLAVRRYVVLPLFALVLTAGAIGLVVVPNIKKTSDLRREIAVAGDELRALETKAQVLQSFDEREQRSQVENLERLLPSKKVVFDWMLSLQGLTQDTGVTLGPFALAPGSLATAGATPSASSPSAPEVAEARPNEPERQTGLQRFSLAVHVRGSFDGIQRFLALLETMKPLMKLASVVLVPALATPEELASPLLVPIEAEANVSFELFYAPLPSELGPLTDPVSPLSESELALYQEIIGFKEYDVSLPQDVVTGRENIFAPF